MILRCFIIIGLTLLHIGRAQMTDQLSDNILARIAQIYSACAHVYGFTPQATVCAAQAILESNLLGKPSTLALKYNNFFGIKGEGTQGSVSMKTNEFIHNKMLKVSDKFSVNLDMVDSIRQHFNLMHRLDRYKQFLYATDVDSAISAMAKSGYATDPKYGIKLQMIVNKYLVNK